MLNFHLRLNWERPAFLTAKEAIEHACFEETSLGNRRQEKRSRPLFPSLPDPGLQTVIVPIQSREDSTIG